MLNRRKAARTSGRGNAPAGAPVVAERLPSGSVADLAAATTEDEQLLVAIGFGAATNEEDVEEHTEEAVDKGQEHDTA